MPSIYGLTGGVNTKQKTLQTLLGGVNTKMKSGYGLMSGVNTKVFSSVLATWTSKFHNWGAYTPKSHNNTGSTIDISLPAIADKTIRYGYEYTFTTPLELPIGATMDSFTWLQVSQGGYHYLYVYFDDVLVESMYVTSMGDGYLTETQTFATARTVSKVSCEIVKGTSSADYMKASGNVSFNINGQSFILNGTNTSDQ